MMSKWDSLLRLYCIWWANGLFFLGWLIIQKNNLNWNTLWRFRSSNYEVAADLTWGNGQLSMHGLGGIIPTTPTKPTWGRSNDTLESIVHQAAITCHNNNNNKEITLQLHGQNSPAANRSSMVSSSGTKCSESPGQVPVMPGPLKKRTRADSDQCGRNFSSMQEGRGDRSACASASATCFRENDTTMMTWASYESLKSLKTKTTDEDSASHGRSVNYKCFCVSFIHALSINVHFGKWKG